MTFYLSPPSFKEYLLIRFNMRRAQLAIEDLVNERNPVIEAVPSRPKETDAAPKDQETVRSPPKQKHAAQKNQVAVRSQPKQKEAAQKDQENKKQKGNRKGSRNYNTEDIEQLISLVASIEPIGSNHWAKVAEEFNTFAFYNDRPKRTQKSLASKWDKLIYTKKRTGDPSCPSYVRQAKRIQNDILAKITALKYTAEENRDDDEGSSSEVDTDEVESVNEMADEFTPQLKKRRLPISATAPFAKRMQVELVESLHQMTKCMAELTESQLRANREGERAKQDMESVVESAITRAVVRIMGKNAQPPLRPNVANNSQ